MFIYPSKYIMTCFKALVYLFSVIANSQLIRAQLSNGVVDQVAQPVEHAEGPTWDTRKNLLYFVDLHNGRVLSYNYNTSVVNSIHLDGDVTPVVPSKHHENVLIVGINRLVVAVEWDGNSSVSPRQKVLATVSQEFPSSRFNDGKADQRGRLWFGTMAQENDKGEAPPNQGILYKITKHRVVKELAPVSISNGLAWNAANTKFFYIDSPTKQVVQYHYNNILGIIFEKSVVFDLRDHPELEGVPDGMTIDENDHLWVALYGGGCVLKIDPKNATLLQKVNLPVKHVTSVMWGGPELDILYVTTSRALLSTAEREEKPTAGSVFSVKGLGTKGLPVYYADVFNGF